jgi:hypothetical protein
MVDQIRQADANTNTEIEVTSDMVEAGALAMSEYDWNVETLRDVAPRVFRAMLMASPSFRRESLS